jgi:Predicted membrane protein
MRKISDYLTITLKGIAMGAADVVPGVSGGTIAFISGIYEELLGSIKSINATTIKLLLTFKLKQFWERINGNFLLALVLGIGISIFSLAKLMTWLLVNEPIATWSFFFGLIIASSLMVSRDVSKWNISAIVALVIGIATAYMITVVTPASTPNTWWFIILSGAIAICAMILPGISGSFILLLLGKYAFIMDAVSNFRINIIALFGMGAIVGIVSFSHVLSWLLTRYRNATIALLTGFMIGSLNKVWPWKKVIETYIDSHGESKPLVESNILPSTYQSINGADPQLWQAILLCVAGFALIYVIEVVAKNISKRREKEQV